MVTVLGLAHSIRTGTVGRDESGRAWLRAYNYRVGSVLRQRCDDAERRLAILGRAGERLGPDGRPRTRKGIQPNLWRR